LGGDGFKVDTARRTNGFTQSRGDNILDKLQPFLRILAVRAEAEGLAFAFGIEDAVRAVSVFFVFNNDNRHISGKNACHRADRSQLVAGHKFIFTRSGDFFGFFGCCNPSFVYQRADYRAFHRAAHLFPRNRRPGVYDCVRLESGDDLARQAYVNPNGLRVY
jgi:hypothetical protein